MSSKNQLSLIAQFDDLNRMVENLLCEESFDSQIKILLQNCEKQRLLGILEHNELNETKENFGQLEKKIRNLEATLKNVREAFKREIVTREKLQAERDLLYTKLNQVQNFLQEDDSSGNDRTSLKETILSSLNLHKLSTLIEENINENSSSLSSVEFDKTDEDVIDNTHIPMQVDKQINSNKPIDQEVQNPVFANEDQFDDYSMLNDTVVIAEDEAITPIQKKNTPSNRSLTSMNSRRSALSETLMRQRLSNLPNELKVDNRPHQFVTKKVFKPEKCCVCIGAIGFCSSCIHCRDCRAICHIGCKEKVPLPCIPHVSRANIGKQGRLVLISDYIPSNCKPCVPALVVHCIAEIERRGFYEVGIYRVSSSEREVKELKEKILKSSHGIPQLAKIEIHVLCNVVKKFLLQLDEALIIRVMWRDFVAAANHESEEDRRTHFQEAIMNLPNANRDTLAFLMLHLRRVSRYTENKMNISNLSKIFGHIVLGYSIRDPPAMQIFEENKKQQQVVEYLLNLNDEFWQSILDLDTNNHLNYSINPGDISLHISPKQQTKGRPSIGARLWGGQVNSGAITPLRNKKKNKSIL